MFEFKIAVGVWLLQVGVGKSGILRVSSGSDNSVNPARNRWAPNASITNITQQKSKMSELAHAEIKKSHQTNERADNAQRAIGKMQSSCIVPERQQSLWSKHQGGVVGRSEVVDHGPIECCSRTRCGDSVVISQNLSTACMWRD